MQQISELVTVDATRVDLTAGDTLDKAWRLAKCMASGQLMPQHLKNPSDCLRVVDLAMRSGHSPFAIADKTYFVSGKMAFEGQLCAAFVNGHPSMKTRLRYDCEGEGKELSVTVSGTLEGEEEPRSLTVYLRQALLSRSPKNKHWDTNPEQQLCYYAARTWARRNAPEILLGMYTPEEVRAIPVEIEQLATPPGGDKSAIASVTVKDGSSRVPKPDNGAAKTEEKPAAESEATEADAPEEVHSDTRPEKPVDGLVWENTDTGERRRFRGGQWRRLKPAPGPSAGEIVTPCAHPKWVKSTDLDDGITTEHCAACGFIRKHVVERDDHDRDRDSMPTVEEMRQIIAEEGAKKRAAKQKPTCKTCGATGVELNKDRLCEDCYIATTMVEPADTIQPSDETHDCRTRPEIEMRVSPNGRAPAPMWMQHEDKTAEAMGKTRRGQIFGTLKAMNVPDEYRKAAVKRLYGLDSMSEMTSDQARHFANLIQACQHHDDWGVFAEPEGE